MTDEKFRRFLEESSPQQIQELIKALQIYNDEELNELALCLIVIT